MSIELTRIALNIINLSSTEKHVLKSFCFRANAKNEAYSSIERLEIDTGLKKRTIEPSMKKLRDKNILIYTGQMKGSMRNIPVYRVNLNHGNFCRGLTLTTAIYVVNTGNFCVEMTAKIAGKKDYDLKDNIKDNGFSLTQTSNTKFNPEDQDRAHEKRLEEYKAAVNTRNPRKKIMCYNEQVTKSRGVT